MKKITDSIKNSMIEIKECLAIERDQTIDMLRTYKNYVLGKDITSEEMKAANRQIIDVFRASGLTIMIILPGSVVTIPFLVKVARKYNIELLPDSFLSKEDEKEETQ